MWTMEMVREEDLAALAEVTPAQREALRRVHLAENMANFSGTTFVKRLEQQFQIEADLRNAREAEERVAAARSNLRLVSSEGRP